jgi:hypothetical protein
MINQQNNTTKKPLNQNKMKATLQRRAKRLIKADWVDFRFFFINKCYKNKQTNNEEGC